MKYTRVLDHGYIRHVESWGKGDAGTIEASEGTRTTEDYECGIIEAARQSTQASFRGWESQGIKGQPGYVPGDQELLKHLYSNKHMGPFEFAGMTIEVQAPIFVFREWHRHRTQSYNEMSARYAAVPLDKYLPTMDRIMQVNELTKNKQAGNIGGIYLTSDNAIKWLSRVEAAYLAAQEAYRFGLAVGVAKELARIPMPVGNYSRMRATGNLRNWLAFMTLRCDPAAQWEIRQYAQQVAAIIMVQFPKTYQRWCE